MSGSERPNVFAGPYVDRLHPPRHDAAAVEQALLGAAARLVPVWRSRNLLRRRPEPAACLLPLDERLRARLDPGELILLGTFRGQVAFAAEFTDETAPELDPGTEFLDLRLAGGLLDHEEAGLLAYARAMLSWRRRHRFCGACGSPTRVGQAGHVMACGNPACAAQSFPRLDPAIIVLVTDGERALLGRQSAWPAGRYSTLAGFVEPGESLEDAVRREVLEETGVRLGAVRYHSSQPWPFPSSLMLGFTAEALTTEVRLGDDELEDARWLTRADLAGGAVSLPTPHSVSFRLIADWYESAASRPLAGEPGVRLWTPGR